MRDINQVVVSGQVTRLTPFKGKMAVVRMEVNITNSREEITPVKVVTFGETAEYVGKNVQEGDKVLVVGNLRMNVYRTKEGKESRSMEIGGNGVVLCKDIES